ncbi:MAG: SpoIIE family protein phosphatase [Clostridia bacterium]|nr:SpoIIE family protein phosphatase [Clostridia bacterium]
MNKKEQMVETKEVGDGVKIGGWLKKAFFGMAYALWGYVLSGVTLPFGAAPFGIALLAASDRRVLYVLGGGCLWALGNREGPILLSVFALTVILRMLTRLALDLPARLRAKKRNEVTLGEVMPHFFREHVALRMATAAVAVFAVGMIRLRTGGYLFYDLYGTVMSVVIAPPAVLLLSGLFEKDREGWRYQLGFLTLGTLLCYGGAGIRLYGISLGVFGAMFAALYVSRKRGWLAGTVTGLLFGFAIAPLFSPAVAIGALLAGVMFPYSVGLGAFFSFSASLGWGYYVYGLGILNGPFAALLATHLLFPIWDRLFGEKKEEQEKTAETAEASSSVRTATPSTFFSEDRMRLNDSMERIRALCSGFRELGETFDRSARARGHAEEGDLKEICERAFDACCTSCPTKEICWGEQFQNMSDAIGEIAMTLHQKGRADRSDVNGALSERCGRMSDILEEICHNTAMYEAKLLESDRTEIFAEDFLMVSEMLAAAMNEQSLAYECDVTATEALNRELSETNLSACGKVIGKRRRRVLVGCKDGESLFRDRDALRAMAEKCVGSGLEEVGFHRDEGILEWVERPKMRVRMAKRTACALGEDEFCGDSTEAFSNSSENFYALISDGMGSGKEAALTSRITGTFLKKLIEAEGGCEESLRLLNVFLRNRGSGSLHECSATADLLSLDLMEGKASFYKSGAAPTYVYRDGGLFKLRSRTVPLGILRDPDVKKIGLEIGSGDLIIMVSDGVTQGREECPWLYDLLRSHAERSDVERLADLVVKYAKDEGSTDDISVMVLRIEAA